MSSESNERKKLTVADPVTAEDLARFSELQAARIQIAERGLDLEQEKVRILRAASSVDTERQRLFEKILMERGLPPNAPIEVDGKSGLIKLVGDVGPSEALEGEEPGG